MKHKKLIISIVIAVVLIVSGLSAYKMHIDNVEKEQLKVEMESIVEVEKSIEQNQQTVQDESYDDKIVEGDELAEQKAKGHSSDDLKPKDNETTTDDEEFVNGNNLNGGSHNAVAE